MSANAPDDSTTASSQSKPTFYFHVGLHKTGTTFLQESLCYNHPFTDPLFLRDNLVYLGTCPKDIPDDHNRTKFVIHNAFSLFKYHIWNIQPYIPLAWNGSFPEEHLRYPLNDDFAFVTRLQELISTAERDNNGVVPNVLMVYEEASFFTDGMIEELKRILMPTWNVQVLVLHRDLPEWLVSVHNEIHQLNPSIPEYTTGWKHRVIPMDLTDSAIDTTQMFLGMEATEYHVAQRVHDMYVRHFGDSAVQLVSMGQVMTRPSATSRGDPLLQFVLCDFVRAPHACVAERQQTIGGDTVLDTNRYHDLTFDLLAQEARDRYWVPETANRLAVAKAIQAELKYMRNVSLADMPWNCPTNATLDRLERVAALIDGKIIQHWLTDPRQPAAHQARFQHVVATKKLCHVNVQAVFEQDPQGWWNLFQSIEWEGGSESSDKESGNNDSDL